MKKFNKYQKKVQDIGNYDPIQPKGIIGAMFVAEEGAEVLKCFKHAMKDRVDIDEDDLKEEMGDVLLALANLANEMGYSLKDIANASIDKLSDKMDYSEEDDE